MLIFKKISKISAILILIIILVLSFFFFTKNLKAQSLELERVFLKRTSCDLNTTLGAWSWSFLITSENLKDGQNIKVYLTKDGTPGITSENKLIIKDNSASYSTGNVLKTSSKYYVAVTVGDRSEVMAIYVGDTANSGEKECPPEIEQDRSDRSRPTPESLLLVDQKGIATDTNYILLESLPDGSNEGFNSFESDPTKNPCPFGKYLNILIKLCIGICSVLAVLMIVKGGVEYMTGASPSEKGSGKSTITNAILGLIVALGAYLILYTVNPNLLNFCLDQQLPEVTVIVNGESTSNPRPIEKVDLEKITGIYCPGEGGRDKLPEISKSFLNHVTYNQNKRNTTDSTTTYFDCSSFISQVYSCAGLTPPGNTTFDMFNGTNASKKVENVKMGDLLGWKKGENGEKSGHVFMSLGGNTIIEVSNPPDGINVNAHLNSLDKYKRRVMHIIML